MRLLFTIILSLVTLFLSAQDKTTTYINDPSSNPPDLIVNLTHIRADISFKPEENLVLAKTEFTFTTNRYQTDSIVFSAPEFKISAVQLKSKEGIAISSTWKLIGVTWLFIPLMQS
jgi:aminopeptidase N